MAENEIVDLQAEIEGWWSLSGDMRPDTWMMPWPSVGQYGRNLANVSSHADQQAVLDEARDTFADVAHGFDAADGEAQRLGAGRKKLAVLSEMESNRLLRANPELAIRLWGAWALRAGAGF